MIYEIRYEEGVFKVRISEQLKGKFEICLNEKIFNTDTREISRGIYSLIINGKCYEFISKCIGDTEIEIKIDDKSYLLDVYDEKKAYLLLMKREQIEKGDRDKSCLKSMSLSGFQYISSPMPGKVVRVLVEKGASVKAGQGIIIVEAMKMENELRAHQDSIVREIFVMEGQAIEAGERLVVLE